MARYALLTFGCQMNQHDSSRMREVLERGGFSAVENARDADLVVLNTCSVREKAEQKLRSEVGRLGMLKRERPDLVLVVAGCVAQQEGERLLRALPQIDLVLGPDNIAELPALVAEAAAGGPPRVRTVFDVESPRFLRAESEPGRTPVSAFVTVMKGCDERCTYCIVPTTRGPERYRPAAEILDEVERLVATGAREIVLLGQTVDSYREPEGRLASWLAEDARFGEDLDSGAPWGAGHRPDASEFPALLRAIAARAPGLGRLRYTSPHPRHLTEALIRAHRELPVLARHVHLPVQSGSDRVLRRMLRRHTRAEYVERVGRLSAAVPSLTLSTDLIVGFPGETNEDFEETLALVREVRFTGVFAFKYSERPGVPAVALGDDVSEEEKSERLARLFELSEGLRREHLAGLVGRREVVLVEGRGKTGAFTGRLERNEIAHFVCSGDPTGELLPVRVTRAFKHSVEAEVEDLARRPSIESGASTPPAPRPRARRSLHVV